MAASVTIVDVAKAAGVSISTVSNALTGQRAVNAETRERVRKVARELGYRVNKAAHSLRTGVHHAIALVVPDISTPFFAEVALGVEDAAKDADCAVYLSNSKHSLARQAEYLDRYSRSVDGILVFPMSDDPSPLEGVVRAGIPVVVCDERVELSGAGGVYTDNRMGGRLAAEHFQSIGARRPVVVAGLTTLPTTRDRVDGFERSILAESGKKLGKRDIVHAPPTREGGRLAIRQLLGRTPDLDAVFATSDIAAVGVLEELRAVGRRVPDDVVVCGFDGIELGEMVSPTLTTIVQQSYQLGVEAVRLVLDMAHRSTPPRDITLSVSLRERESTAR